ncbi:hypothetical protein CCYN2B_60125 [Capnocytophaga cynodegmi]|uniref:Uncharacterized protein n=1 Tax=Capnocytophaga cynodegmi TaxID=28189 RepID=A0A0B7HI77_9FLAO|nr:hypothetical protein CCYN2B_60125 [Capnocytophaga cynodegmi]
MFLCLSFNFFIKVINSPKKFIQHNEKYIFIDLFSGNEFPEYCTDLANPRKELEIHA